MRLQAGRRVALMAALALMVGAGQWLRVSADVPQVAANTWASAGDFGATPEGSAAAPLTDGRIVVAGGHYSDGTLVSQVGIYNPASQSWEDGGQLSMARTGHTVTALDDGRVLIAGGRTVNGPSFDVEIYNPNTRQSVHAGDLWVPRVNHAAVELGSGLVLVAGGSNGSGFLDYLELFDSTSGQTESLSIRLGVAREKLTATRLLDGHVLLAGGRDGSGNLAIAEIFVSGSRSIFETGSLRTARSGHAAVLLPNNNQVLIAGGTVTGAPSATAELYADWRDGFRAVPNPMSQARSGAVAGVLPQHHLGFVGGGGSTSGEYFGYATVKTDRADYWPGETVTITGSGWQPGETVTLKISEDADTHHDFTYTAVADAQGNITNAEFAPIENEVFHHFGMRFYLTATGAASTALNTFTDGNASVSGIVTNSVTGLPVSGASVTCTAVCNGNIDIKTTNATGNYTLGVTFPGNSAEITLTASAAGYVTKSEPVSVSVANGGPGFTRNFALVPLATSTTTSVSSSPNPSTYGSDATFTATVSPSTATGSVQFKDGGVDLGAAVPVAGGQAVLVTSALLAGSHSITAVFTATGAFTDSTSAIHVHQVDPKPLTITATDQNKVYGTAVTPTGTEFTTTALVGTDSVTSVTLSSQGYAATASVADSPHQITPSAAVGSGLTNYSITYAVGTMTVNARPVTVTADPKTKTYGEADPALTYELTSGSLVGSDDFTGALARAAGENVGSYAIQQGTLTLGTNYNITFVGANLSITPRAITVTAQPKTKVYGETDPALTYQITLGSLVGTDSFSGALTRVTGENVGSYAIQQGTLALSTNYALTFVGANLSITPRPITVTADPKSKTYGESDPALTYQITLGSLVGTDTFSGALMRVAGEDVGSYAIQQGTLALSTNYALTFVGANLSITARPITVTADPKTKTYGESDPALTYQITLGSLVGTDSFSGALTRVAGEDVGSYAIQQGTLALSTNYVLTFVGANLSITARSITVTADPKTKTYGESDPALTYQVTSGSLVGSDTFTGAVTRVAGEDVGHYAIQQGTLALSTNYALTFVGANLSITARLVTVTADAKTKTYGEADPALTYQLTSGSLVGTETFSGALTRVAGEDVGNYAIQQGTLALSTNYALTFVGANLSITPRAAMVTAHNTNRKYGDANPTFTADVTNTVNNDTLNFVLTTTATEASGIGNYPITVTLGANPNYDVTSHNGTLTVEPRPASVAANNKQKPYNTDNPGLDATVTGTVNNDVLNYTLATTAMKTSDVGVYPIVVTLGSNPNYAVVPTNGTLTIVQATQTITFPAIGPKNYGDVFTVSANASSGLPVTFAASGSCGVAGAVVTVTAVGSCTVTASQAGNNNYLAAPNVPQTFNASYTWSGVLQPINQDGSSIFKLGSTIPVKFQLTGASASVTNLAAKIYVAMVSNGTAGTEIEASTNAAADAGNQFRYDPSGQLYIYNWGTKLSAAVTEGTWQIRIDLQDGAVHTVLVTLKK